MLDLAIVKRQIDQMAKEQKDSQNTFLDKMKTAYNLLIEWSAKWQELSDKVERSKTSWLLAGITGPLKQSYPKPERPKEVTVAATDGSQIFPDRHEVSSCYLINIGSVMIHYGTGERPLLTCDPSLFYREKDLYQTWGGRRAFMNSEILATKRGSLEFKALADLSETAASEDRTAVALSDGTLIMWTLEGTPPDFKGQALKPFLDSFDRIKEADVPLAGYISHPGSSDVINTLRVGLCPLEAADCDRCPWKEEVENSIIPQLPCEPIEGVTDGLLFSRVLKEGERSPVFASSSRVLDEYEVHRVFFFYVNAGWEIARVEVPGWVAKDERLLELVHSVICDQAQKGSGYPIVLSEAHEKAVVRGKDRDIFYQFLRDVLVKNDIKTAISSKSLKKLGPTV